MSVYGRATCEMTDLARLQEAIERAGLGAGVKVYPNGDGVYRKYNGQVGCAGGPVRGRDAHVVIHGGLDNSGMYMRGRPDVGGCGDTAFILESDGTVRAEIDTNHNNAPVNWELIQNYYAAIGIERKARAGGVNLTLTVDKETGKMVGRVIQDRPQARRIQNRRAVQRPQARRA